MSPKKRETTQVKETSKSPYVTSLVKPSSDAEDDMSLEIKRGIVAFIETEASRYAESAAKKAAKAATEAHREVEKNTRKLRLENKALSERIKSLEERLATIELALPGEKVVVLREISKKEAENEISTLFSKGETLYYTDIAERLNLDLQTVVEICRDLQKRGEIKVDDNSL